MILARLSVQRNDFLPVRNWKDMTRSWIGMINKNSENPANAEGPSCHGRAAGMHESR